MTSSTAPASRRTAPATRCGNEASGAEHAPGQEVVICQRCHARQRDRGGEIGDDNGDELIKPISEAIHWETTKRAKGGQITLPTPGRKGGCQGCHPAHRSNGEMNGYPITLAATTCSVNGDNRGAAAAVSWAETCIRTREGQRRRGNAGAPERGGSVAGGERVYNRREAGVPGKKRGLWCTNCHNQLGQEIWKAED